MNEEPRLQLDTSIVVWMAQVSTSREALVHLEAWLDPQDRQRAARFRLPEDRSRFILGRALLRKGVGHHLRRPPEEIELTYTQFGRPLLARDQGIQFSISHTHDWVALALTAGARVGIDLEYLRAMVDPIELAPRIFSDEDLEAFQALPADERAPAFFRAWTRKEAYLKARGEGIAEALRFVSVSFGSEETILLRDRREASVTGSWRLHDLPAPADYMGSIACDEGRKELDCHVVHFDQGEMILDSPNAPK